MPLPSGRFVRFPRKPSAKPMTLERARAFIDYEYDRANHEENEVLKLLEADNKTTPGLRTRLYTGGGTPEEQEKYSWTPALTVWFDEWILRALEDEFGFNDKQAEHILRTAYGPNSGHRLVKNVIKDTEKLAKAIKDFLALEPQLF